MIFFRINDTVVPTDDLEQFNQTLLLKAGEETIRAVQPENEADLTIALDSDEALRELNHQYRNIDTATDVLSFPSHEIDLDSGNLYLGDVIISYPRAVQQAKESGHSINTELQLLVVHGILHLFGYDHLSTDDKKKMWAIQDAVLKQLGIAFLSQSLGD
jgi:probable rRNA maturation factor